MKVVVISCDVVFVLACRPYACISSMHCQLLGWTNHPRPTLQVLPSPHPACHQRSHRLPWIYLRLLPHTQLCQLVQAGQWAGFLVSPRHRVNHCMITVHAAQLLEDIHKKSAVAIVMTELSRCLLTRFISRGRIVLPWRHHLTRLLAGQTQALAAVMAARWP